MMTQQIATRFSVTGFVRNLPDGQVEVVVVGEPDEIVRFLSALAARMDRNIQGHRIDDEPMQNFTAFEIRK